MTARAKKLLLSAFVIALFAAYSFQQKHEGIRTVIAPSQPNPSATGSGSAQPSTVQSTTNYKDGTYTGSAADAYYGYIQVQAVINGGKITDVQFLQYPRDRSTSVEINSQAMPYLKQEAISAQSAHVNVVTGATDSSLAFIQSLDSALAKAL